MAARSNHLLNLIDDYNREGPAIEVDFSRPDKRGGGVAC